MAHVKSRRGNLCKFFKALGFLVASVILALMWWSRAPAHALRALPSLAPAGLAKPSTDSRLGLVLGPGGARGAAHAGVLRALNEAELQPGVLVGVSAGAVAAALYARGYSPEQLAALSSRLTRWALLFPAFSPRAPFSQANLRRLLQPLLGEADFESCPVKLAIVATDLKQSTPHLFTSGPLLPAVCASCAIPAIYTPVELQGTYYVDGAFSSPLPIEVARKLGADYVIAVDLGNPKANTPPPLSPFGLFDTAVNASIANHSRLQAKAADLVVRPDLGHLGIFDYTQPENAENAGYTAMRKALEEAGLWQPGASP